MTDSERSAWMVRLGWRARRHGCTVLAVHDDGSVRLRCEWGEFTASGVIPPDGDDDAAFTLGWLLPGLVDECRRKSGAAAAVPG